MNRTSIACLEYMSRHGLDARVLQEYKQCGMLYFSKRYNENSADLDRFVDFSGVDRNIIRKVDELENNLQISVFHIIWNNNNEIILMYSDLDLDEDYQLDKFKTGTCSAIKYIVNEDTWLYFSLRYEVRLGAVVDVEYKHVI